MCYSCYTTLLSMYRCKSPYLVQYATFLLAANASGGQGCLDRPSECGGLLSRRRLPRAPARSGAIGLGLADAVGFPRGRRRPRPWRRAVLAAGVRPSRRRRPASLPGCGGCRGRRAPADRLARWRLRHDRAGRIARLDDRATQLQPVCSALGVGGRIRAARLPGRAAALTSACAPLSHHARSMPIGPCPCHQLAVPHCPPPCLCAVLPSTVSAPHPGMGHILVRAAAESRTYARPMGPDRPCAERPRPESRPRGGSACGYAAEGAQLGTDVYCFLCWSASSR